MLLKNPHKTTTDLLESLFFPDWRRNAEPLKSNHYQIDLIDRRFANLSPVVFETTDHRLLLKF